MSNSSPNLNIIFKCEPINNTDVLNCSYINKNTNELFSNTKNDKINLRFVLLLVLIIIIIIIINNKK